MAREASLPVPTSPSPLEREVEGSLRHGSGLGNQEKEIRDEHGAGGIKSAGARTILCL